MADPKNPFFARALVNRYWAHFFGRGIVEPLDDMRLTNPPSNPELLDALADDFVKQRLRPEAPGPDDLHEPDLRPLERPERVQRQDKQNFARYYPKRLRRRGAARRDLAGHGRADRVRRPAGRAPGRSSCPTRASPRTSSTCSAGPSATRACECERVSDASLGQSLMLLNSGEVQAKLSAAGGRAEAPREGPAARRREGRRALLGRLRPRPVQRRDRQRPSTTWPRTPTRRAKAAYEDILWALINAKEFQFND